MYGGSEVAETAVLNLQWLERHGRNGMTRMESFFVEALCVCVCLYCCV